MEGGLFQLFDERQAEALLGGERSSSGLGLALEPEEGGFDFSVVRGDSCAFSLSRTASTAMADSPRILMECDTISGEGTPGSSSTTDTAASSAPTATGFLSSSSGANRHAPVRAPAQDDQGGASSATSSSVNPSGYFAFTGGPVGDTGVVRRGAGGLKGERGKKGSVSGSHNSSPRSEGESSRDGSVGTGVAGTGAPDARLEDKKRRNRESARMCRAKKKSSIMALQAEHDDLRASNDNLKKENESLRTVNAALEKQLAFFQNLFRDTMQGGGSKPHLLPVTAPQREGEADPDPQAATFSTAATSSGCALALSLLLATYNMQPTTGIYSRSAGDFVPHDTPFSGRRGRALLSIEEPFGETPYPPPTSASFGGGFWAAAAAAALLSVVVILALSVSLGLSVSIGSTFAKPFTFRAGGPPGGRKLAALRWWRRISRAFVSLGGAQPC